ncbi:MAG TPA: DUF1800 domain-containing protein [Gammaproteobacteria bacterium]|nr:DUF1800 domain-containing protein [Gammaproteobacteria bacterium]
MVGERAVIAANRFGLGARAGELPVVDRDPARWLLDQLDRGPPPQVATLSGSADILRDVQDQQREVRAARQSGDAQAAQAAQRANRTMFRDHFVEHATARYEIAAVTDAPFRERLVLFWSNHFAVSADKPPLPALAGTLENEAIRPHVTGKFVDMLLAVEKHPAMLMYLDNQTSMGPNSPAARMAARRGRDLGLNENLAREILELHTLGVDGGYTQQDVTTFAKVITGWSIGGGPGPSRGLAEGGAVGEFQFRPMMHEPGAKTLLGKTYREGDVAEGERVLRDLAAHPSTARFVARKLARQFAGDDPAPELVERLRASFAKTGGDLGALYRVLVESPEPWTASAQKFKSPQDFMISTYRAFGQRPDKPQQMIAFLDQLGQRPYTPGSPAGFPDVDAQWDSGAALLKRIDWATAVGRFVGDRVNPATLASDLLGPTLTDHTRTAIARAASAAQGLTLLLSSPEFQRR